MSSIVKEEVIFDGDRVMIISEFDNGETVVVEYSREEYEAINGS